MVGGAAVLCTDRMVPSVDVLAMEGLLLGSNKGRGGGRGGGGREGARSLGHPAKEEVCVCDHSLN